MVPCCLEKLLIAIACVRSGDEPSVLIIIGGSYGSAIPAIVVPFLRKASRALQRTGGLAGSMAVIAWKSLRVASARSPPDGLSMGAVVDDRKHVDLCWEAGGSRPHG